MALYILVGYQIYDMIIYRILVETNFSQKIENVINDVLNFGALYGYIYIMHRDQITSQLHNYMIIAGTSYVLYDLLMIS